MRIVLDTGALFRPEALRKLADGPADVVLPAVAYAERLRHFARQGAGSAPLDEMLSMMRITVEPFGAAEAKRIPQAMLNDDIWRRLARDAMIAAHVGPGDELWTTNTKDFVGMGVPESQVIDVSRNR